MKFVEEPHSWFVNDYELAIRREKIACACGYSEKSGVPCSHLIKVVIETHEDIRNYIHDRWKISQAKKVSRIKVPLGQPKHSRRQK